MCNNCLSPRPTLSSEDSSPFLEGGCCCAKGLSSMKISLHITLYSAYEQFNLALVFVGRSSSKNIQPIKSRPLHGCVNFALMTTWTDATDVVDVCLGHLQGMVA